MKKMLNRQGMIVNVKKLNENRNYAISIFVKAMIETDYVNVMKDDLYLVYYCGLKRDDINNNVYANLVNARAEYYKKIGA